MIIRIIFGLITGAIKLAFDVGGFVLEFVGTIIKFVLSFLFICAIFSMFEGYFIPALFVFGIPLAGIGYIIYRIIKRFK